MIKGLTGAGGGTKNSTAGGGPSSSVTRFILLSLILGVGENECTARPEPADAGEEKWHTHPWDGSRMVGLAYLLDCWTFHTEQSSLHRGPSPGHYLLQQWSG